MSFTISYPAWFYILCPLAGAVYAILFYYREGKTAEFQNITKWLLGAFRFLAVALAVFLLLSPLLQDNKNTTEKPILVVLQDNSASILTSNDSVFYKTVYKSLWEKTVTELSERYDVRTLAFGSRLSDSMNYRFDEKETDIAGALEEVNKRYYGKNIGAIILATDGIYNKGFDPLYAAQRIKCPIYTVAMGDTIVKRDAKITKVEHNNTVFLGNTFPLQIVIDAQKLDGKSTVLTVSDVTGGKEEKLFVKPIVYSSPTFHLDVPVQLTAASAGLKHYIVKLNPVEGEENLQNNRSDIYIRVLDRKEKILILSNPHPDVAAIVESINSSDGFEAESFLPSKFTDSHVGSAKTDKTYSPAQDLNKYCLIIVNQLPSANYPIAEILQYAAKLELPVLYIVGGETNINSFNNLNTGIRINSLGNSTADAEAYPAPAFSLFTLDDESDNYFSQCPALATPFASYRVSPSVTALCYQKIQNTNTTYPLIAFNTEGSRKICVICGEGIFRWKMQDYADHKNHIFFDGLIDKMVQYLAVKEDKSFFRIHAPYRFKDDEPVEMDAELYNPSYQLINDPEVTITFTNEGGKNFSYTFSRTTNGYHLNAGMLQPGLYSYTAQVKDGDQLYTKKGDFTVTPVQMETVQTIADHHLLYSMAAGHSGVMLFPRQLNQLVNLIENRTDIKPVIYSHVANSPLIDFKWLFFLILFLAGTEWVIRKWNGIY